MSVSRLFDAVIDLAREQRQALLRPLLLADVDQHVDCADTFAFGIQDWGRKCREVDARAVGPLGDRLLAAEDTLFPQRDGQGTSVVGQGLAISREQLPGDAPSVIAEDGDPSGKIDAGAVEIGDPAVAIGGVDGRGQILEDLAIADFPLAEGVDGGVQNLDLGQPGGWIR